jgi:kynurenine formamidase
MSIRLRISSRGCGPWDQIDLKELILPLAVVDVHSESEKNPDYNLTVERLKKWEADHGQIPVGTFVAMRTDWSKRWPDSAKNGKQRCERCGALSGLEFAGAEISV